MGASVGVFLDQMSPELKEAIELSEKQKFTIAEFDAAMLDRETSKVFKKHGKIIKTLTSRTKAQLRRTLTVKNRVPDDIYKIVGGNNNYSLFMKQLHMSKHEIEMENLRSSSKTELYDEELLINIVGTSTNKELKAFCELYAKEKGTPLPDVFVSKTKPESQLQRFIAMCWSFDREEGKTVDEKLAAQQAADIHKAGAARLLGCDEEMIFKILATSSRAQCAAIADQYLTQFNMKFERAINMKFKGSCGKLMLLWALPIPVSIITCIHFYEERMIIDKVAIISMVSKYDKDVLAQVDIAAEKAYEKNLLGIVQRGLSGNLLKAVAEWIENASPDKGYERVTELFLENQQSFGRSLEDLFKNAEFQQRLLFLLKKETEEVEKYMKDHRIKFNPQDKLDLKHLDSFDAYHSTAGNSNKKGEIINKYNNKAPAERDTSEYDAKYKALQNYFKGFFSGFDKRNVGIFEEKEFWSLMKELPLEALGLTEHEIDAMMEFSEWVSDGKVNYHEAIFELADSVLTFIESKKTGETDVLTVVTDLSKDGAHTAKSEKKVARHESVEEIMEVPDYFLQYIYDTFFAYDFDNNGYLCKDELDAVLPVLNIAMTYKDFIAEETDKIIHKEAVQIIARRVQPWFLDKENDNYLCLVDKDSGLFFWYNCKDESSQWADNEGEGWAGYGSRRASTYSPDATFSNSLIGAALAGGSGKSAAPSTSASPNAAPKKSPRAPTAADEKEMADMAASAMKDAAGEAKGEPKSIGIAGRDDEDDEGDAGADADVKTVGTTPQESGKKAEGTVPALELDAKAPSDAEAAAQGSPRASPRAAAAAGATAGSPRASPRAAAATAGSPRAASIEVSPRPGEAKADDTPVTASADEPKPASPRAEDKAEKTEDKPTAEAAKASPRAEAKAAEEKASAPAAAAASPRPSASTKASPRGPSSINVNTEGGEAGTTPATVVADDVRGGAVEPSAEVPVASVEATAE